MNRADIIEIVGQFVRLKKRGANYIANCPFHSEKTPSFSVSASKSIYKCFGCGKAGNVVNFVQEHEKLTYPEAIHWLADYYKIALEETERSQEQIQHHQVEEALRILNEYAAKFFNESLLQTEEGQNIGLSYFKQRGLRKEIIDRFHLGYDAEDGQSFYKEATQKGYTTELLEKAGLIKNRNGQFFDNYRGRVIFPIQNMTGRVLGFGARILKSNDKAPKYINSPENELYVKSKVLYGMFQSRQAINKQDECFLVEGYTDVISLHQGGVENVLASSGTSLTEDQLRLIGQLTKNLTILYDGDAAGVKAALRGLDMALSQSFNVKLVLLPEGEDPDSFIQKQGSSGFHEYVKTNKQDVISFRIQVGLKDVGNDPIAKSKLINEIAESISKINKAEDFALQDYYIRETASKLQIEEAGLVNLINKFIRDRVEQERRISRREEDNPIPQEATTDFPEPILSINKLDAEALQEWELIRALIEHGFKSYAGYESAASMIYERVDPELFTTKAVSEIYAAYFNFKKVYEQYPEMSYFLNYPDETIRRQMITILHTRNEISHNWKELYQIESLNGELNYLNELDSALSYFELKKILKMQEEIVIKMQIENDPSQVVFLIKNMNALRIAEKEIVSKHGTVVLSTVKKR